MNLNMSEWKKFYLKNLCNISIAKSADIGNLEAGPTPFVGRSDTNNGVQEYVNANVITKGKCISLSMVGTNVAFWQEADFQASQNIAVLRADCFNKDNALFLCSLLNLEMRDKYSYGRTVGKMNLLEMELKLPIQHNPDGTPYIDPNHTYSEDGYVPDWQFMEDYMKSLHHKPLTTKNTVRNGLALNVDEWKEFLLADYFDIMPGKYHYPNEYERGDTPYYSASNENNGIGQYIDLPPDFSGNCIVTGKIGCTAFYAPDAFCATSDVNVFQPKFQMSSFVGLFITSIINLSENYKWAYGRQCRAGNSRKIQIKLPVDNNGNPDWQFMEDYMKSLPYGDRL